MLDRYNKVVILGLGGTGSILAPLLARYLFSEKFTGRLILVDGDIYSDTNSNRQIFSALHIGKNKAEYQAMVLVSHLPDLEPQIEVIDRYIGEDDAALLVEDGTIVVNCSDNFAARKIIEDNMDKCNDAIHICCGNDLFTGQVQVHSRIDGKDITPSIYQRSPNFNSLVGDRSKMSCEEMAALPGGGQLITANATSAILALNMFVQCTSDEKLFLGGEWLPCDMVGFNTRQNGFVSEGKMEIDLGKVIQYVPKRLQASV